MTKEQILKFIELIDAKMNEYAARDSSDSGLIETITTYRIKEELLELAIDFKN